MAIQTGKLHQTINLDNPEPALEGIDMVGKVTEEFKVDAALSNSFGFGGHNASLIFAPYQS